MKAFLLPVKLDIYIKFIVNNVIGELLVILLKFVSISEKLRG